MGGIVLPMLFCAPDAKGGAGRHRILRNDFWFEKDPTALWTPTQQLPGSIYYMEEDLFGQVVFSIVKQLARAGSGWWLCTDMVRQSTGQRRIRRIGESFYGIRVITCFTTDESVIKGYMSDHAAGNETMITRALYPELVHMENLPEKDGRLGCSGEDPRVVGTEENGWRVINHHRARMGAIIREILKN